MITVGPELPNPTYHHCGLRRKSTGVVYFVGGPGAIENIPWIHSFDTNSKVFKLLPPRLAVGKTGAACVILDVEGLLVIAHGFSHGWNKEDTVEIIDLEGLTITTAQPTQQPLGRLLTVDEQLFLWYEGTFLEYDALHDHWLTVEDLPINMSRIPLIFVTIQADSAQVCQYV